MNLPKVNTEKEEFDLKIGEIIPRNMLMISPKYSEKVRKDNTTEAISHNFRVIAKNSMVLPNILKILGVLNTGILKITKIGLEKDKKLNLAKFKLQENEYEEKYKKTPERIVPRENTRSKILKPGFLDNLLDVGSVLLGISGMLAGKYFSDPSFKNMLDSTFASLKESLAESFNKFSKNIFGENGGDTFKDNLTAIGIGLAATIASVKLAFSFFTEILKSAGKILAKSLGISTPDFMDTNKSSDKKNTKSAPKDGTDKDTRSDDRKRTILKKRNNNDRNETNKLKDFANKVHRNGWYSRLFNKLKMRFGLGLAMRAAAFITGMMIPVVGWIATAIAFALTINEAYAIYDEIFKPNGILDELEKEDSLLNKTNQPNKTNLEPTTNMNPEAISEMNSMESSTDMTPTKIRNDFDYQKYTSAVGKKESTDNYEADNGRGFLGKYQFGASALETFGYLKAGSSKNNTYAVYSPENWTGKDNIKNSFDFLNSPDVQEKVMANYTKSQYKQLQKSGVINAEDTTSEIAAKLYAAHHGGVGGANKYFLQGIDTRDTYLPNESIGKSASYMQSEYSSGQYLRNQSNEVAAMKESGSPIQYVDASTVNNMQQGGQSNQPVQLTHASVVDNDLMNMLLKNMWGN